MLDEYDIKRIGLKTCARLYFFKQSTKMLLGWYLVFMAHFSVAQLFFAVYICIAKFSLSILYSPYKLAHENRLTKLTELV